MPDLVDLRTFYHTPLGQAARRLLRQKMLQFWPSLGGMSVMALGYATVLMRPYVGQGAHVMGFMPAMQGVSAWPREGPNRSCLVEPFNLPLPDNSVDRVVLLHMLESSENIAASLREVWRVMKSGGRMIAIVPNRRGIWAMSDATPFGAGQPFSPSQFKDILRDNNFLPERAARALYLPPWHGALWLKLADTAEKWGGAMFPTLGGVLLIEASKQLYAPVGPARARQRKALVMPSPFLPAPGGPLASR
ncbi:MAG: methyltransferase domain-containing protein [Alphaproteobacteria bacterium]